MIVGLPYARGSAGPRHCLHDVESMQIVAMFWEQDAVGAAS